MERIDRLSSPAAHDIQDGPGQAPFTWREETANPRQRRNMCVTFNNHSNRVTRTGLFSSFPFWANVDWPLFFSYLVINTNHATAFLQIISVFFFRFMPTIHSMCCQACLVIHSSHYRCSTTVETCQIFWGKSFQKWCSYSCETECGQCWSSIEAKGKSWMQSFFSSVSTLPFWIWSLSHLAHHPCIYTLHSLYSAGQALNMLFPNCMFWQDLHSKGFNSKMKLPESRTEILVTTEQLLFVLPFMWSNIHMSPTRFFK